MSGRRVMRGAFRALGCGLKIGLLLAAAAAVFAISMYLTVERHFQQSKVVVPDVRGLPVAEAERRLAEIDLTLSVEARVPHESIEPGVVSFQDPIPGDQTRRRRAVKVAVSTGHQRLTIPDVVGQSRREAQIELRNAQLEPGEVLQSHGRASAGTVVAQIPQPGEMLGDSGSVDLLVSLGPPRRAYVMSDLVGRTLHDAEQVLMSAGIRMPMPRAEFVAGVAPGHVIAQSPAAGSRVYRDTAVNITVSKALDVPMAQ